jgi:hypothetical protein
LKPAAIGPETWARSTAPSARSSNTFHTCRIVGRPSWKRPVAEVAHSKGVRRGNGRRPIIGCYDRGERRRLSLDLLPGRPGTQLRMMLETHHRGPGVSID